MGRVSLPAALSLCALVIGSWDGGTAHGFSLPPPPSSHHFSSPWRGKYWKSSSSWRHRPVNRLLGWKSSESWSRSRARWAMLSGGRGGNNNDSGDGIRPRGSIDLQPLEPIGLDLPPQPLFTASARDVRAAFKRNSKYGKGEKMSPSDLSSALKELGVVFTEGQLQVIVCTLGILRLGQVAHIVYISCPCSCGFVHSLVSNGTCSAPSRCLK
jgi:hypothetical protein